MKSPSVRVRRQAKNPSVRQIAMYRTIVTMVIGDVLMQSLERYPGVEAYGRRPKKKTAAEAAVFLARP
jgi:hypothetical protein